MPHVLSGEVARPIAGGALLGHVDKFTRALASSIESSYPMTEERARHWILLCLTICGAAIVRFWGLGAVGLHGDEETMAMAVRGIVEQGAPILPSGMFYPRGLTQLALMSLSVSVFGESEWALRLPSAVCGVVLIPLGYLVGRRFLRPAWSLALAAALAFLPELVVYSQTARMYIFLVTFIATSMLCIFAWERTGRIQWLIGAIVALIFGLEMHSLAIACMLMLLLPGAVQGDMRKLGIGLIAMVAVSIGFVTIEMFVGAQYPDPPSDLFGSASTAAGGPSVQPSLPLGVQVALWVAGLALAFLALRMIRGASSNAWSILAGALLVLGVGLQLALFYHLAALCYVGGLVMATRAGMLAKPKRLAIFFAGAAAIAIAHAILLAPAAGTIIRLVGAVNGQPSAWPYVRVAGFSVLAAVLCAGLLVWGLYRIARRLAVPDFWLLAVLGAWAPVFALGMFAWDVPTRYTATSLLPMLISALACAQLIADKVLERRGVRRAPADALCAIVLAVGVVNPVAAAATINAGYRIFPDHKGAAEFMRSQAIKDEDVILAEDILQQTYYLGRVDYWLIGPEVARRFVMKTDTGIVDFYTGTPVVVTNEMLDQVLNENAGKRIFIVGSGEGWDRGYRDVRGELHGAITSGKFETLFVGRDGLTRVLRAVPATPSRRAPAKTSEQSREDLTESAEVALEEAAQEGAAPLPVK